MAYSKTIWQNNSSPFINSQNLNKIEEGIEGAHGLAGERVKNGGGVPEMVSDLDANLANYPPGVAGRLFVARDRPRIYRDTGAAWEVKTGLDWSDLTNKPQTFPPAPHNHDDLYKKLASERVAERPATDAASTYPTGVSIMEVLTAAGWPAATGIVQTLRYSDGRTLQRFVQKNAGVEKVRWWNEATLAWSSFASPNAPEFAPASHIGSGGAAHAAATGTAQGFVELATAAEIQAGTAGVLVASAAELKAELDRRAALKSQVGAIDNGPAIFSNVTVSTTTLLSADLRALTGVPADASGVFATFYAPPQAAISHVGISSADATPGGSARVVGNTSGVEVTCVPVALGTGANAGKIALMVIIGGNCAGLYAWVNGWWR